MDDTCCAFICATSRLMASIFTGFFATLRRAAISCCRICDPSHANDLTKKHDKAEDLQTIGRWFDYIG